MLRQISLIVCSGAASVLLGACSLYDSLHDSGVAAGNTSVKNSAWNYQKSWKSVDFPSELTRLTGNKVTLKGQCHFSSDMLLSNASGKRAVLLPFLDVSGDGTLGPDFDRSVSVYEGLQSAWNMAPKVESLQLFQYWVSSVEHACPDDMNRKLSQCSLKNVYSLGGLWGNKGLYDFDRLNHWLARKADIGVILVPNLSLLSSEAVLSLKYSIRSVPVTNQPTARRLARVSPYLGRQSIDWIKLDPKGELGSELTSSGQCSVTWLELEKLRSGNTGQDLPIKQLAQINQVLIPQLLVFLNAALQEAGINKH